MSKPLVAITLGDPAGVGPETIVRAWQAVNRLDLCRPFVIGQPDFLRQALEVCGLSQQLCVITIGSPEEAASLAYTTSAEVIPCLPAGTPDSLNVPKGKNDALGGQAAYDALILTAELALSKRIDAITTAPLSKTALHMAGHDFPGHTELLAEICGIPWGEVAMMLYMAQGERVKGPAGLGVAHVTLHTALRNVFEQMTIPRIVASCHLADAVMGALLPKDASRAPRIGVAALNPHGGEQGLMGNEEQTTITPAVEQGIREGMNLTGPLPCDTLMVRAAAGEFDGVVAMYHDQGHIALKLLGMDQAVNITLGLPIIRTSVAHGTAFDIAWKGIVRSESMVEAIRVAAQLVSVRDRLVWNAAPTAS